MQEILYAFLSSFGFGVLFNVRGKNLIMASLGGSLGWLVYSITKLYLGSEIISLFLAAIALSTFSEILARIMKNPVTIFLICALIPLVPGGGMYYTTFEAVQGNFDASLTTGFQTLFQAGAIAVGVVFVSTISRLISRIKLITKKKHTKKATE